MKQHESECPWWNKNACLERSPGVTGEKNAALVISNLDSKCVLTLALQPGLASVGEGLVRHGARGQHARQRRTRCRSMPLRKPTLFAAAGGSARAAAAAAR